MHGAEWGDVGDEQFTDDEPTEGEEHASYRLSPSRPPNLLTQLSPVPPPRTIPNPEASSSSDPLPSDGPRLVSHAVQVLGDQVLISIGTVLHTNKQVSTGH